MKINTIIGTDRNGEYTFSLKDETLECSIEKFKILDINKRPLKDLKIPGEVNQGPITYKVTEIKPWAFKNSGVSSVILPPQIKKIGENAFDGCYFSETNIDTKNVKEINEKAFSGITFEKEIKGQGLFSFKIGEKIPGKNMWEAEIKDIKLNEDVKALIIPEEVSCDFCRCIPTSITVWGLGKQKQLDYVSFNKNMKDIGGLLSSTKVKNTNIKELVGKVDEMGNFGVFSRNKFKYKHPGVGTYTLKATWVTNKETYIKIESFKPDKGVKNIKVPKIIPTEINPFAFKDAVSVVRYIAPRAFFNLDLKKVELPDSLKGIGSSAFKSNDLNQIVIPELITELPKNVFSDNLNFKKITTLSSKFKELRPETFNNSNVEIWIANSDSEVVFANSKDASFKRDVITKIYNKTGAGVVNSKNGCETNLQNQYPFKEFKKRPSYSAICEKEEFILEPFINTNDLRDSSIRLILDTHSHWKEFELECAIGFKVKRKDEETESSHIMFPYHPGIDEIEQILDFWEKEFNVQRDKIKVRPL